MRVSMRPVKLPRVVEVALFVAPAGAVTVEALAARLDATPNRAREIAEEMVRMGLLGRSDGGYASTSAGRRLIDEIAADRWPLVHEEFMAYPFYRDFFTTLDKLPSATYNELLELLREGETHFNLATVDNLSEWAERLGSVQRNPYTKQIYTLRESNQPLVPSFLAAYSRLKREPYAKLKPRRVTSVAPPAPPPWSGTRYVEIGHLREMICQELRCARPSFDRRFASLCTQNIGRLELSGVPITSTTNKSRHRVRTVSVMALPSQLVMDFDTAYYEKGIAINGRMYSLLAYHGGDLRE